MQENKPLLSICIPTYNRANYIGACLDSIVSQFEDTFVKENTEIVITDNASTDNTEEIVKKYTEKYNNIHYFKNEKNLGFDRSFTKLIEKSKGVYCLSIGDDDAFFENSLKIILEKIKDRKIPFYSLNFWGYDSELKNPVLSAPNFQISKDLYFEKLDDYIKSIKEYTNIVGVFVGLSTQLFLREPFINFPDKAKYFDTLAVHMYTNLSMFKGKPFSIISEPIIKTRASNIRWDVFDGLGTANGRIKETIKTFKWIINEYNIIIPNHKIYLYFYSREYWFTFKEIIKSILTRLHLGKIINIYRKLR